MKSQHERFWEKVRQGHDGCVHAATLVSDAIMPPKRRKIMQECDEGCRIKVLACWGEDAEPITLYVLGAKGQAEYVELLRKLEILARQVDYMECKACGATLT